MSCSVASTTKKRRTSCVTHGLVKQIEDEDLASNDNSLKPKMLVFDTVPVMDIPMQHSHTSHATATPLKRRFIEHLPLSVLMQRSCPSKLFVRPLQQSPSEATEDWTSPMAEGKAVPSVLDRMVSTIASPLRTRLSFPDEKSFSNVEGRMKSMSVQLSNPQAASTKWHGINFNGVDVSIPISSDEEYEDNENIADISSDATENVPSPSLRPRLEDLDHSDVTSEATDVPSDLDDMEVTRSDNWKEQPTSRREASLDSSERISNLSETPTEQRDSDLSFEEEASPSLRPTSVSEGALNLDGHVVANLSMSARENHLQAKEDQWKEEEQQLKVKEGMLRAKEEQWRAKELVTVTHGRRLCTSKARSEKERIPSVTVGLASRVAALRRSQQQRQQLQQQHHHPDETRAAVAAANAALHALSAMNAASRAVHHT